MVMNLPTLGGQFIHLAEAIRSFEWIIIGDALQPLENRMV